MVIVKPALVTTHTPGTSMPVYTPVSPHLHTQQANMPVYSPLFTTSA